jgi:hypothetical protein
MQTYLTYSVWHGWHLAHPKADLSLKRENLNLHDGNSLVDLRFVSPTQKLGSYFWLSCRNSLIQKKYQRWPIPIKSGY